MPAQMSPHAAVVAYDEEDRIRREQEQQQRQQRIAQMQAQPLPAPAQGQGPAQAGGAQQAPPQQGGSTGWNGWESAGGGAGNGAAMQSGNPYAIAAMAVKSYLQGSEKKRAERKGLQNQVAARRAGQLGYPTYDLQASEMRNRQRAGDIGKIGFDPMG